MLSSFFFFVTGDVCLCVFVCLVLLLPFVLGFCLLGFFFVYFVFFSSFSSELWGWQVLGLQLGIGPEPPRWESQDQDVGPPQPPGPMKY